MGDGQHCLDLWGAGNPNCLGSTASDTPETHAAVLYAPVSHCSLGQESPSWDHSSALDAHHHLDAAHPIMVFASICHILGIARDRAATCSREQLALVGEPAAVYKGSNPALGPGIASWIALPSSTPVCQIFDVFGAAQQEFTSYA
ncbi:hypothetical protein WOLCODRAFT_163359 [Wolfiporia cocos MD-104 SS10]|uniref:Uncharacterized protein n=1 Tax=Wolfiporia cocos (strain MD-104) TaxID=742152 RepID=A0A2H3JHV3_WOLCO|nr:hypothetical protein WOLCODRAFT_163359 [Wolfiporia cocos MD-104 SS10]